MIRPEPAEREQWGRKIEFLFACIGFAVGYGNFWRFPYMCFKNGGGAFLIPYVSFLLLGGIPLFFMELSIGQILQAGPVMAWNKLSRVFSGIGFAMITVSFLVSVYYNVILAWSIYYLYNSFKSDIPWVGCHHAWNTNRCYELNATNTGYHGNTTTVSSSKEFFIHNVLEMTSGIDQPGGINHKLAVCFFVAWVLVYFCIWKGICTTGKVVYVTATLPYVFLVILFTRAITLPGSLDGIMYYITPTWTRLADPKVWIDAASQILYSLTIGFGVLIGFASYNKRDNDVYKDALLISLVNCGTSVFAGFVVFAVVGHMAHIQGSTPAQVASQGPGLVFIVYPATLAQLPAPQVWSVIFFLMLITLGLDSQFGQVEVVATSVIEQYNLHRYREAVVLVVCLIMFTLGLSCVTQGGIYVFYLFDSFSAGISLLFLVLFELLVVGWIYGAQKLANNIEAATGRRVSTWWVLCWKAVTPLMIIGIFLFSVIKYQSVAYEGKEYPSWAEGLGWSIACCSMLCIPVTAANVLMNAEGSFFERLRSTTHEKENICNIESSNSQREPLPHAP